MLRLVLLSVILMLCMSAVFSAHVSRENDNISSEVSHENLFEDNMLLEVDTDTDLDAEVDVDADMELDADADRFIPNTITPRILKAATTPEAKAAAEAKIIEALKTINKFSPMAHTPAETKKDDFVTISNRSGHVYMKSGEYSLCVESKNVQCVGNAVSSASFKTNLHKTGWDELHVKTSPDFDDYEQAFAAGYIEGSLTWERIAAFLEIWVIGKRTPAQLEMIDTWVDRHDKYVRGQVATVGTKANMLKGDPVAKYWYHVGLVLKQMDGVLAGFNAHSTSIKMTAKQLYMINNDGDVLDIERFVKPGMRFKEINKMTVDEVYSFLALNGHCSAMVKWTGDDIIIGHNTWTDFKETIRIYKHYNFNYKYVKAKKSSHSSYPGMIYSSDDFYVLDSGLVIMETTINILNEQLYKKCNPDASVMTFIRSLVANMMASNGQEWTEIFSQQNSGTYNNQWMIVDFNKFKPNTKTLAPGVFWVLEQIPGRVVAKDMSSLLQEQTYWGSYNRPFFMEINNESMFKHYSSLHGEIFSYKSSSRAKIMAREHSKVKDVESMKALLRHNDYKNDPYSRGCPYRALAARFDVPGTPQCPLNIMKPNGATDAKVTSYKWRGQQKSVAVSGPTVTKDLPPFDWSQQSGKYANMKHKLHPQKFDFKWTNFAPFAIPQSKTHL